MRIINIKYARKNPQLYHSRSDFDSYQDVEYPLGNTSTCMEYQAI